MLITNLEAILQSFLANYPITKTQWENALQTTLRQLVALTLDIPHPASGKTLQRWQVLAQVAATDLNLAKLFEAHLDAVSILYELGVNKIDKGIWGVWAAEGGSSPLTFDGTYCSGIKPWCSGSNEVDYGLISYRDTSGIAQLLMVSMHEQGISKDNSNWHAVGMPFTQTSTLSFAQVPAYRVPATADNNYLTRAGFWHGAAGVAVCWYGATAWLGQYLLMAYQQKPHAYKAMYLGEISTQLAVTQQAIYRLAKLIDSEPKKSHELAVRQLRALIEQTARLVLDRVGQALGATPFCTHAQFARLSADLPVFIRQTHGAFDWQQIGELTAQLAVPQLTPMTKGANPWQL